MSFLFILAHCFMLTFMSIYQFFSLFSYFFFMHSCLCFSFHPFCVSSSSAYWCTYYYFFYQFLLCFCKAEVGSSGSKIREKKTFTPLFTVLISNFIFFYSSFFLLRLPFMSVCQFCRFAGSFLFGFWHEWCCFLPFLCLRVLFFLLLYLFLFLIPHLHPQPWKKEREYI